MKNIVLVGFMGTGKTTIGRELARRLKRPFVDTDRLVESREKMKIAEIFRTRGEEHFRAMENAVIQDVARQEDQVIATGGGVMMNPENVSRLKETGVLVLLEAKPETIFERTEGDARPLLSKGQRLDEICRLLESRRSGYAQADVRVQTDEGDIASQSEAVLAVLTGRGFKFEEGR